MIADKNEVIALVEMLKHVSSDVFSDEVRYSNEGEYEKIVTLHEDFLDCANDFIKQSIFLQERINALNAKKKSKALPLHCVPAP